MFKELFFSYFLSQMKKIYIVLGGIITLIVLVQACSKLQPAAPADDELLDGSVAGLSYEQNKQFLAGDVAFNDEIFTSANGLGPIFFVFCCGCCHLGHVNVFSFITLS